MTPNLPYGGKEIADLRAKRQRPADMVLVSLVGPLHESNPLVMARPEKSYDWRFLTGLDVLIVADTTIDKPLIKRATDAIAEFNPSYLGVWFKDVQQGLNVAWGGYRTQSRRMCAADRRDLKGVGA